MAIKLSETRILYRNKEAVSNHWNKRHSERKYDVLKKTAESELYNFTWIATVNTFIEQGNLSATDKVLDIGFGWGRTIIGLKKFMPDINVTGIEISEKAIKNAHIIFDEYLGDYSNINLELGDVEDLKYADSSFDSVLSTRVFQYLTNPQKGLAHIHRVLVPDGKAVVMVPNKANPYQLFFYHTQVISSLTLKTWFREAGFKNIETGSIIFFPSKLHRFSSDSAWVKVERMLTKIPLINKLGGIVWVSGEK
jgi:ubiquinone/menaquinone biosynthesis C-methylase UbiE